MCASTLLSLHRRSASWVHPTGIITRQNGTLIADVYLTDTYDFTELLLPNDNPYKDDLRGDFFNDLGYWGQSFKLGAEYDIEVHVIVPLG